MKALWIFLVLMRIFSCFGQNRNDVVIDELMADPLPPALAAGGLPEAEFIELKNISLHAFNLNGWTISDATSTATIRTNFILQPDSFVLLCSTGNQVRFGAYGATLGVANFPALDNEGEMLSLRAANGRQIHGVYYRDGWYGNSVKKEGGWSLEMIDPQNPCGEDNWLASSAPAGGTPGKRNSVNSVNRDDKPPALVRAFAPDPLHIDLLFSEPLDSSRARFAGNYSVNDGIGPASVAIPQAPMFDHVMLNLPVPLQENTIYRVTLKKIADCSGNEMTESTARVALASTAAPMDIVINEILFNPADDGVDYVELYNRSSKTFNITTLLVSSRTATGNQSNAKQIYPEDRLLFPGDFLVLTETPVFVRNRFNAKDPAAIVPLEPMPSYPDDRGTVILLNNTGKTIDELAYDEDWHFKLLNNREGVALERIDPNTPTQDVMNWHSAATSAGYGTPTAQNSQYRASGIADAVIQVLPEVFSPDNDGRDDFATINYALPEPGYSCTITIFNANGRLVKKLASNALCGLQGGFTWDGLDDRQSSLGIGVYICITSVFNLKGKTRHFKHPIVLARKLQ